MHSPIVSLLGPKNRFGWFVRYGTLALGVIGEYVGRLHLNVNRKPQYTEREVLGQDPAGSNDAGDAGHAAGHS